MERKYDIVMRTDGSATPNPGRGAYGGVIRLIDKVTKDDVLSIEYYGLPNESMRVTNNQMEYTAAVTGMGFINNGLKAIDFKGHKFNPEEVDHVEILVDSQLVAYQNMYQNGSTKPIYAVKNAALKELRDTLHRYIGASKVETVSVDWNPRDNNSMADSLCRKALESGIDGKTIFDFRVFPYTTGTITC